MSAIAGIFRPHGAPVLARELEIMTATMAHRGGDGVGHWSEESIGFGHCMRRVTTASTAESQPHRDHAADLCITMDGRLDNRRELAAALGLASNSSPLSDSELVIRAYARWGDQCASRLLGEYAIALWDGRRRRLLCVRDFLGKKPFFYANGRYGLRFASEPQAVLADAAVSREPNEAMVGEFLAAQPTTNSETLFRELLRLPPAHLLVATADGLQLRRYWEWDANRQVRYSSDDEYAENLLALCLEAVRSRCDTPWPVGASLSGGVDSSSVVGLLCELRRRGQGPDRLEVFSMVYPGRECDESAFVRAVAELNGIEPHLTQPEAVGAEPYVAQTHRYLDLADFPNGMAHRHHLRKARQLGCRAFFTGKGPDVWLAGTRYALADDLRNGRVGAVTRRLATVAQTGDRSTVVRHLWQFGLKPQTPPGIRRRARSLTGRLSGPSFIQPSFLKRIDLANRLPIASARPPTLARQQAASGLSDGLLVYANEAEDRVTAAEGLEVRDPFDDRPLTEFCLSLPDDQRYRAGLTKYVLRKAMGDRLPDVVRRRPDKSDYSHLFVDELRTQGGCRLFRGLKVAEYGWVDEDQALRAYETLERTLTTGQSPKLDFLWHLWLIVSLERWLEAI